MADAISAMTIGQVNRNRVFRYIYMSKEPVTKQNIATALSLSLPTVSTNLKELFERNLLVYCGASDSTGGRKPQTMGVNTQALVALGMLISDSEVRIIAADFRLNEIAYEKRRIKFSDSDKYYKTVSDMVESFVESRLGGAEVYGLGIALPGIVNIKNHTVEFAPTLRMKNKKLDDLRAFFSYPVWFENDANASGIAEIIMNHPSAENVAYLSLDSGIGGMVRMGGAGYIGDNGRSAEFGHMCVEPHGKKCSCGKNGCLEAYCSVSRISDDIGMTPEEFFAALEKGDPDISAKWDEYLGHLALGISNIRTIFDCDILIGGNITGYLENYAGRLRKLVAERSTFETDGSFIRFGTLKSAACIGAVVHFVEEFLSNI